MTIVRRDLRRDVVAWIGALALVLAGTVRAVEPPVLTEGPSQPPATGAQGGKAGAEAAAPPPAPSSGATVPATLIDEATHAWVVVPQPDRRQSVIFHVPPRTGQVGARLGVAYIAERLVGVPARIAAWGSRVYMVTAPEAVGESRHRRVYTKNARYEGAWGWSYQPTDRLGVLPSLPPEGELVSLAADAGGLSALLWTPVSPGAGAGAGAGAAGRGTWSAFRLDGVTAEAWAPLALPWEVGAGGMSGATIEPPLRGCAALVVLEGKLVAVALRPRGPAATGVEGWTRDGEAWARTIGPEAAPLGWTPDGDALVGIDGRIVEVVAESIGGGDGAGGVTVHSLWPLVRRAIATVSTEPDQPGSAVGVGVLDRGVLAVMWRGTADGARRNERVTEPPMGMPGAGDVVARTDTARFKLAEVSTRTGRVLARGPVRQPTPLADRPLHVVALLTAAFMAGLLIYTLRRGDGKELPAPFRPGGVMRRAVATGLDLVVGLALAGLVWRSAPADLLTVQSLLGSVTDAAPVWATLALAAAHSTLAEIMIGGSVGKVAVGCRVGVVAPGSGDVPARVRRVSPQAVIVRNLTKWALLPAAAVAVFDPLHRHAADVVAGTVVIDLPEEPSAPAASGQ